VKKRSNTARPKYYTHGHNIEGCLANGSYCRLDPDGVIAQYMNGDYMGTRESIPAGMVEVPADDAQRLLPKVCR